MTDETSTDASAASDVEPSPIGQPPSSVERAMPWERIDWIACAVLTLVTLALVALHVRAYPTLSPIDELQHVDYVLKAGDFEIPHKNDLVGYEAMDEAACRGIDLSAIPTQGVAPPRAIGWAGAGAGSGSGASPLGAVQAGPECGAPEHDPQDFQENGVNTAAGQLPPYYLATGVVSRAVTATGLVGSQVTAARLVGGLWAAAAWSVMWYAMSLLGIRRAQRAIALTIMLAAPLTLFHSATVNVDGVLMLTGAAALVATLQFERGRLHGGLLLLVSFLLYLVEPTVFLALCSAAAYLLVRVSPRRELATWERGLPLALLAMVLVMRLFVYRPLQQALFPPSAVTNRPTMFLDNALPSGGVDWSRVFDQLDANFLPIVNPYLAPVLDEPTTSMFIQLSNWLLIATLLIAAFGFIRDRRIVWLARATIVTLLAAGPFYTFSFAYFSGADFDAPGRFGLPMIAFIAAVAAASLRTRSATLTGWVVATGAMANTVVLLLAA